MASEVPAENVARLLGGVLQGFVIRHSMLRDVDVATFGNGLRALFAPV